MKTFWQTGKRVLFGLLFIFSLNLAFFIPSLSVKAASAGPVPFKGSYYNNMTLSGTPMLIRQDQAVNFFWGTASPGRNIPADHFSARWMRTAFFQEGTYQFTVTADDGVRLLIDGRMVIDQWHDQSAQSYTAILSLSGSVAHTVVMEYYENRGSASAALSWQQVNTDGSFVGTYYANRQLEGVPAQMRVVPSIDFAWGNGSPSSTIPQDNFSVRWTMTTPLNTGQYQFTVTADDGVRLYLDGKPIIDKWNDQPATTYTSIKMISAGIHTITMEYYEHWGSATAHLNWQTVSAGNGFVGVYYDNMTLSGIPTQMHIDPVVRFAWGYGSPNSTIPADQFSVRWIRNAHFNEGTYRFTVVADDGVRLFVDGAPIIDHWRDQSATRYVRSIRLTQGVHSIIVEYYENSGVATANLNVQLISS